MALSNRVCSFVEFAIETPDEVFVYEEDGRIIVEQVPDLNQLHGINAGDHKPGEFLTRTRELDDDDRQQEATEAETLVDRHGSEE